MVVVAQSQTLISALCLSKNGVIMEKNHSEMLSFSQIEFREMLLVSEGF